MSQLNLFLYPRAKSDNARFYASQAPDSPGYNVEAHCDTVKLCVQKQPSPKLLDAVGQECCLLPLPFVNPTLCATKDEARFLLGIINNNYPHGFGINDEQAAILKKKLEDIVMGSVMILTAIHGTPKLLPEPTDDVAQDR